MASTNAKYGPFRLRVSKTVALACGCPINPSGISHPAGPDPSQPFAHERDMISDALVVEQSTIGADGELLSVRSNSADSRGRKLALALDEAWCRAVLATLGDRPTLLSFLFHAVLPEDTTASSEAVVDPAQTLSADSLNSFIRYFLRHGYTFVSPDMILGELPANGRYVFMTFDDGYYNNIHALPVLRRNNVPATFFISTNHVLRGRSFWWDIVYRERLRRGAALDAIAHERDLLKRLTHDAIDSYLAEQFGAAALDPVGDEDRPLTPAELRGFAADPLVHLGNHTMDHAILTNYSPRQIEAQIGGAQDALMSMTGQRPNAIAYPNGSYSAAVLRIANQCGLDLGITLDPRRNAIRPTDETKLALGRHCVTQGHTNGRVLLSYRAGTSLTRAVEAWRWRQATKSQRRLNQG